MHVHTHTHARTHTDRERKRNIELTYYKLSNAKNYESISTKSLLNTNTSNKQVE